MRENGKNWHATRAPFRPLSTQVPSSSASTAFAKRAALTVSLKATKAKIKELRDEKEAERQRRVQAIKDKRAAKEERERWAKLEERMHKKRVERLRRREKRNKLLNS